MKIHTEGESLRQQAESLRQRAELLHAPVDRKPMSVIWKGSLLKRCLIGVGMLTGSGLTGVSTYRYYAGRQASTSQDPAEKAARPVSSGMSVKPVAPQPGSQGALEDSFGNHSQQHHDDTGNRIRHKQRYAPVNERIILFKEEKTTPSSEDVKIVKLDFSCIEERQSLSVADVFRQIGKTLRNPVSELAKESQVIHYYNKLGQCPTPEDIRKLEVITSRVDYIVSGVLTLLPGSRPLFLTQNLGGPLFKIIGDYIDNREGDIRDDIQEIAEQSPFIAKAIAEYAPIDNNGHVCDKDTFLPKGMSFYQGKLTTDIDGDKWGLSYEKDRFVATKDNEKRQVEYSREEEEWKLGRDIKELKTEESLFGKDNVVYSIEKTQRIISELAVDVKNYERINDGTDTDLYWVTNSNGRRLTYIKINEKFLPVRTIASDVSHFEIYDIKRPEKTGYSILVGSDNKFHFGKFLSPYMRHGVDFIDYVSSKLHRFIPHSYYINNLDLTGFTPINSRGIVKSPDGNKYIFMNKGYVKIERHPLFAHVYQLGPSESDKVLCYYDKASNKFFSIPEEMSLSGKPVERGRSKVEGEFYKQENIWKEEFEKQKSLKSYRDGFRTNDFENYKIVKIIDKKQSARVSKFYLYGLNKEEVNHAAKYKSAARQIKKDITNAQVAIEKIKDSVLNPEHDSNVMKRFHEIFDIKPGTAEAQDLTDLFIKNVDGTKEVIDEYIADDFKRIWLVKNKDNTIAGETWINDPLRRMFINLKETNAYKNKNTLPGRLHLGSTKKNDVLTIIHEASHQGADTDDFFYMHDMTLDEKISRLKTGQMNKKEIETLLKSDEAYSSPFNLKTDREYAQGLYNTNPSVRMRFLLNNADSFAAIINDLFSESARISKRDINFERLTKADVIHLFSTVYFK